MSTSSLPPKGATAITLTRKTSRTPTILTLPLELHLLIASHLPFPAYLSLRLSHPYLYRALAAPRNPTLLRHLDQCARVAVRTYLAPYLSAVPQDDETSSPSPPATIMPQGKSTNDEDQTQRCALCSNAYPLRLFKSAASSACTTQDFSSAPAGSADAEQLDAETNDVLAGKKRGEADWDVVEMPERVCCWHVGRLARIVRTAVPGPEMTDGQWISRVEQMCTHCGAIQAWRRCRCRCQSCSVRPARTYTRYAGQGWGCAGFVFWRDGGGKLWVRETVWTDDDHRTTAIMDKPVIFE